MHLVAQLVGQLLAPPAIAQGHGDGALGVLLADDEPVEFRDDFARREFGHGGPFLTGLDRPKQMATIDQGNAGQNGFGRIQIRDCFSAKRPKQARTLPVMTKESRREMAVSRRNLFGGIALGMLMPQTLSAQEVRAALLKLDRAGLYAILRGAAFLEQFRDPVLDDDLKALIEQIADLAPEAWDLLDIFRFYGETPHGQPRREEEPHGLAMLHTAVAEAGSVEFGYVDLDGNATQRRVKPLALVHPAHGIQLLAYCELRGDYRKFFVRAMQNITRRAERFEAERCDLVAELVETEGLRDSGWAGIYDESS